MNTKDAAIYHKLTALRGEFMTMKARAEAAEAERDRLRAVPEITIMNRLDSDNRQLSEALDELLRVADSLGDYHNDSMADTAIRAGRKLLKQHKNFVSNPNTK